MIDQFVHWYFGVALFIFTYNDGFPDMSTFARRPRHRRTDDAPRIETGAWVKAMSRRIEASVSRDRLFGFVTWNYLFRFSVNLSHSLYAYDRKDSASTKGKITPQSLENGAIDIAKSLWGSYTDVQGQLKSVGGDTTKVCYVLGLSPAAQILLKNISYTARRIPGTQETIRIMLFSTQAYRLRYGSFISGTFFL